jgi:hypothetical protein
MHSAMADVPVSAANNSARTDSNCSVVIDDHDAAPGQQAHVAQAPA